jgi:hypothetical protein
MPSVAGSHRQAAPAPSLCPSIKFFIEPIQIFSVDERRYHKPLMRSSFDDFYTHITVSLLFASFKGRASLAP